MLPDGILDYFEITKIDEEVTNEKDETAQQHDLFTFLSNKDGHGRKGTLVAAVKGTTVADVTRHLEKTAIILHETDQQGVLSFFKIQFGSIKTWRFGMVRKRGERPLLTALKNEYNFIGLRS